LFYCRVSKNKNGLCVCNKCKKKPCFSVLDGMQMLNAIFHVRENLELKPMP
jgi:hypothetical protein